MNDSNFNKLWVLFYIRYDTCGKDDKGNVGKKCNLEGKFDYIMEHKKYIFDLNDPVLDDLKNFLRLFNNK